MVFRNILFISLLYIFIILIVLLTTMGSNINAMVQLQANQNSLIADTLVQTPSGTLTVILTEQSTPTATSFLEMTATVTPSMTNTALNTLQNTQSHTPGRSGTPTNTPAITTTTTPNITNTPGPTETFEPLPSITLLFPIETATHTQESTLFGASSNVQEKAENSDREQTGRISARSILLIGTVLLLWVILAIFLIFFFRKLGE